MGEVVLALKRQRDGVVWRRFTPPGERGSRSIKTAGIISGGGPPKNLVDTNMTPEMETKEVGYLYDHLNIIDNKASALLTFQCRVFSFYLDLDGIRWAKLSTSDIRSGVYRSADLLSGVNSCGWFWLTWARGTQGYTGQWPNTIEPRKSARRTEERYAQTRTANYQLAWWISATVYSLPSCQSLRSTQLAPC